MINIQQGMSPQLYMSMNGLNNLYNINDLTTSTTMTTSTTTYDINNDDNINIIIS